MVETRGLVAAVEACDAMLKASAVKLVRRRVTWPGHCHHLYHRGYGCRAGRCGRRHARCREDRPSAELPRDTASWFGDRGPGRRPGAGFMGSGGATCRRTRPCTPCTRGIARSRVACAGAQLRGFSPVGKRDIQRQPQQVAGTACSFSAAVVSLNWRLADT